MEEKNNTNLPFQFAIARICRQLLNFIGSVIRCAWQKAEK